MDISWAAPFLEVRDAPGKGRGVFTTRLVRRGELVAVFGGFVISFAKLQSLARTDPEAYEVVLQIGCQISPDLLIAPIARDQYSTVEYVNHSCSPNCGFAQQLDLVAMRDIASGEEITMDYAMCTTSPVLEMDCACAAPNCRGRVTATDWRKPELAARYAGYFQPYIETLRAQDLVED